MAAPNKPLVLIEWQDSRQPVSGWAWLSDITIGEIVLCQSVGWLLHDDDDVKVLAPNVGDIADDDSQQVSGVIRIPARSVVRILPLSGQPT